LLAISQENKNIKHKTLTNDKLNFESMSIPVYSTNPLQKLDNLDDGI
jgi:hypothetical protein